MLTNGTKIQIHPEIIYKIGDEIAHPLTLIFNRSLESNQILEIWKCANITSSLYTTRNSSGDEIANVNFLYDNIVQYTYYKIQ